MSALHLDTTRRTEAIDVTDRIAALVEGSGFAWVGCGHTTCALVVSKVDEALLADLERAASTLLAPTEPFGHRRDGNPNAVAHIVSALTGQHVVLPVRDGRLQLGRYQRIVLLELDGPRARRIDAEMLSARRPAEEDT